MKKPPGALTLKRFIKNFRKDRDPRAAIQIAAERGKRTKLLKLLDMDFTAQAKKAQPQVKGVFQSCGTFAAALTKKGYVRLGGGAFSQVYGHPNSDRVIKLQMRPGGDGWLEYVQWAEANGYAGKFAPKVYSYKYNAKGQFGMAVMERLDRTLHRVGRKEDVRAVSTLFGMSRDVPLAYTLLDLAEPGLAEFGNKLAETFRGHLDYHNGNFMTRKDGSFVVSDPVAGMDDKVGLYKKRWKPLAMAA